LLAFASLASVPAVDVKIPSIMQVTASKLRAGWLRAL
jgi:hypothetical protein